MDSSLPSEVPSMSSTDSRAPVARRIDTAGAFSEEATFIDSAGQPLFSMLHRPLRHSVRGGLVICPSIYAEMMAAYPMDVAIARSLASRGIAVQRFHYRGAGHSGGDAADVTFSECEDALVAANRLRDQIDGAPIAVAGTRFRRTRRRFHRRRTPGVTARSRGARTEGRRFFRDAWRARLIRDTKELAATRPDHRGLPDALAAEGAVDILGYEIRLTLYESVADRTLARELNEASIASFSSSSDAQGRYGGISRPPSGRLKGWGVT